MAKTTRGQRLRMEADLADLEEAFIEKKAERPRCSECGRLTRESDLTAAEKKANKVLEADKLVLREARRKVRETRPAPEPK